MTGTYIHNATHVNSYGGFLVGWKLRHGDGDVTLSVRPKQNDWPPTRNFRVNEVKSNCKHITSRKRPFYRTFILYICIICLLIWCVLFKFSVFSVKLSYMSSHVHLCVLHLSDLLSLQFDGAFVVSGSLDTSIRVWDAETGRDFSPDTNITQFI